MAFPDIPTVAGGRVLTTNQLDTTATRTFPSLTGLTKNAGDLLIAIIVTYQSTTNPQFSSWGGGFTEFHDSGSSTTLGIGIAYKWSTGSETGTFSVTQATTITGDASMILLSIPGVHQTTPPEAGSRADATGAAADPASFDPSGWGTEDTLWISLVGSGMTAIAGTWDATGTTAPTNYTNRVDTNASDTSTIGDCEAAVAFRQLNAGSVDIGTAGVDVSNARNSALVIAVRPAPPQPELVAEQAAEAEVATDVALTTERLFAVEQGIEANVATDTPLSTAKTIIVEQGVEADTALDATFITEPFLTVEAATEADVANDAAFAVELGFVVEQGIEADTAEEVVFGPDAGVQFILDLGAEADVAFDVEISTASSEPEFEVDLGVEANVAIDIEISADLAEVFFDVEVGVEADVASDVLMYGIDVVYNPNQILSSEPVHQVTSIIALASR